MKILFNQYLKDYNTIKIGGKVRWMFFPINAGQIIEAVKFAWQNKTPFFILAGGSNTVFEDIGLNSRQVVINLCEMDGLEYDNQSGCHLEHSERSRASIEKTQPPSPLDKGNLPYISSDPNFNKQTLPKYVFKKGNLTTSNFSINFLTIQTDPGVSLQKIVDIALYKNAGGMVGLNRVPGTIGGAVVGNAGAYGCEIMSFVDTVEYIDLQEIIKQPDWVSVHILENKDCNFGYRDSIFKHNKDWLITSITLKIPVDLDLTSSIAKYNEIAIKRDAVYPKGFASPGSLFKNILFDTLRPEVQQNIPAEWVMYGNKLPVGKLLESLGLQGFGVGKIQMRPTHANIMTNLGGATYKDAKETVRILQFKVKEKFGIDIEPEVRFIDGNFNQFWK
jgi:UDP-N-acetylmuramate dehydrogenase